MWCGTSLARLQAGFLLIALLLFDFVSKGLSIKCVKCTTLTDKGCEEGLLPARDCKPEENYCLTYTGRVNLGFVVFRGCSKDPIQDDCHIKIIKNQNVRACYTTCNTTACNSGYASGTGAARSLPMQEVSLCLPVFLLVALRAISFAYLVT